MNKLNRAVHALLFSIVVVPSAGAQDRPPPHEPPAAAREACRGRASGDACTFSGCGGETVSGVCRAPEGRPLACAPPHHGRHHGPPPEAIEACRDTDVGDACVVDTPHGTLEGTCVETPAGTACRPNGPPPPHDGPGKTSGRTGRSV